MSIPDIYRIVASYDACNQDEIAGEKQSPTFQPDGQSFTTGHTCLSSCMSSHQVASLIPAPQRLTPIRHALHLYVKNPATTDFRLDFIDQYMEMASGLSKHHKRIPFALADAMHLMFSEDKSQRNFMNRYWYETRDLSDAIISSTDLCCDQEHTRSRLDLHFPETSDRSQTSDRVSPPAQHRAARCDMV
jgi:hypothetical protein